MTAHPWHDLPFGADAPEVVTAFIEVPKDSMMKYELDKDSGFIKLDRVLYSAVHYPGDYGFIPQTLSEDGDPIDVLIISTLPVVPGVIVRARPIGMLEMFDEEERDEKIIAVHANDPRFDRYQDISDMSDHVIIEIKHFFETYKELQGKKVMIKSIQGKAAAQQEILNSIEAYKKSFVEKENKKKFYFFSCIPSSSSCSVAAGLGASIMRSSASFVFGNAMTSRMFSSPAKSMIILSSPNANPPCGGAP